MRHFFYQLMTAMTKLFGTWIFVIFARIIAAGYFILFPRRVAVGMGFYRALFPRRSQLFYLWCTWKQFQNFTTLFLDRFLLQTGYDIPFSFQGREHLKKARQEGTGGIILMSHVGNWEIAAHLLHRSLPDLPLMLYMGQRAKDEIEKVQKQDLKTNGIRVVTIDRDGGSPFDLVEGVNFLRQGGFLSMAGDLNWHQSQRTVETAFLNHKIQLPAPPHSLAMLSGAPIFIFLASRDNQRHYHFKILEPYSVRAATRKDRETALTQSVGTYARRLEAHLRSTPYEWYHFEPFLGAEMDLN